MENQRGVSLIGCGITSGEEGVLGYMIRTPMPLVVVNDWSPITALASSPIVLGVLLMGLMGIAQGLHV
jgi:hypothetical protein